MPASTNGVLRFAPIDEALCLRSGTPTWARLTDDQDHPVLDADVGLPDSDADVIVNDLTLCKGGAVQITLVQLSE